MGYNLHSSFIAALECSCEMRLCKQRLLILIYVSPTFVIVTNQACIYIYLRLIYIFTYMKTWIGFRVELMKPFHLSNSIVIIQLSQINNIIIVWKILSFFLTMVNDKWKIRWFLSKAYVPLYQKTNYLFREKANIKLWPKLMYAPS